MKLPKTFHQQSIYVYLFKCVQINDWCYIVTVTLQYLKPFNCAQIND